MSIESAKYIVQRGLLPSKCQGDQLRDKIQNRDRLVVQHASDEAASKWEYTEFETTVNSQWETIEKNKLNADLGLTPRVIGALAFEIDMFMGDNNTMYYIYHNYLLKSTDGFTWEVVNSDLPFHQWAFDQPDTYKEGWMTQCSYIDGIMFVNYINRIWKSADNGVTWKEVANYQSHFHDKYDLRVKKAYHKASDTNIVFFSTSKSDKNYSYMVYSTDEGETWTQWRSRFGRGKWWIWLEDQQHFLVLSNNQQSSGGDMIFAVPWEAVADDDNTNYSHKVNVPCSDVYTHEFFIKTPKYIFVKGGTGWNSYVLDHDCNILHSQNNASCAWTEPRHACHCDYDPRADDVLCGEYRRKSNSTSAPISGRFRIQEVDPDKYLYCTAPGVDVNYQNKEGGTMVYHPPTKRYYQAIDQGIFYSFEQLPNDDDFIKKSEKVIKTNIDDIDDTDWLCCTDDNDTTYKVNGARFKELFGEPKPPWWEHNGGVWHVKNPTNPVYLSPASFEAYDLDGNSLGPISQFDSELVFLTPPDAHNLFSNNSYQNWEFGELTDTSRVTNMRSLLSNAEVFNSYIGDWDVSNVTTMDSMFSNCKLFNTEIGDWKIDSLVDASSMFSNARAFNQDISGWTTNNLKDVGSMFSNAVSFNQDISSWVVASVTRANNMFYNAVKFNSDLSNWNVGRVTNMYSMFAKARVFNSDVSRWDVSSVTSMSDMFSYANKFDSDVSSWQVSNVGRMTRMFQNCRLFASDLSNWDVSNVDGMAGMFSNCYLFNSDISGWDVRKVDNMSRMFNYAKIFSQDIGGWEVGNVTDMRGVFDGAEVFNAPIGSWNTSKVTDMEYMFRNAAEFDQDISSWSTINVKSMRGMFYTAKVFKSDISTWDVSKVTDMDNMFWIASEFNSDLSMWCVTNIEDEPLNFAEGATSWTLPKPIWGTCS